MNEYTEKLVEEFKKDNPTFVLDQVFSGHILEINGQTAYVRLYDETNETEELEAEIDIAHFPKDDPLYPTLTPGCIFYWYLGHIGDNEDDGFSIFKMSQATWTKEMIEEAKIAGEKLFKSLNIE